jgi:hypothetical protein
MQLIPERLCCPDIYVVNAIETDSTVIDRFHLHSVQPLTKLVPAQLDPQPRNILALESPVEPETIISRWASGW